MLLKAVSCVFYCISDVAHFTWGVHLLRSPNFFSRGMEAVRSVKVVGGDVAVL